MFVKSDNLFLIIFDLFPLNIYIYLDFMIKNMLLISKYKICLRYYYAQGNN